MYEKFEHGADIGIKGRGPTLNEAFAETAKAMFDVMVDVGNIELKKEIRISVSAPNKEELLVEFLNQLLTQADLNNMVFKKFVVHISDNKLQALVFGEELDPQRHNIKTEVKAATYSMLKIGKENGGYFAQCVIDV